MSGVDIYFFLDVLRVVDGFKWFRRIGSWIPDSYLIKIGPVLVGWVGAMFLSFEEFGSNRSG